MLGPQSLRHLPTRTNSRWPTFKIPSVGSQSQISASSQLSVHNARKRQCFQGWAVYTDGSTRLDDGETLAGWCAVARSLHGRKDIFWAHLSRPKHILHSKVAGSTFQQYS